MWGGWSTVWSFTIDITLEVPANPSPPSRSSTTDTTPLLDWEDITSASAYHIQVNTAEDFNGTVIADDYSLTESQYQIGTVLTDNTTYYWRVRIKNEDGIPGEWSSTWSFTVDIAPPVTPSPQDGANITDNTPLLDWEDIAGAIGYHIQVNTNSSFTGTFIADNSNLTLSEFQVGSTLNKNTTYYWRVKIKNEDGIWGNWSNTWSFTIVDYFAKTYGGCGGARAIQETSDGGFVVLGNNHSFGAGGEDWWILRLNSDGSVVWQKTYGGTDQDYPYFIQETSDGGFIAVGWTLSFGAGNMDAWVLKLNSDGSIAWQKAYGGNSVDQLKSVQETSDGGFIIAGTTASFGLDLDCWILKLSGDGTIAWQKRYYGDGGDYINSIQQTSDGGYIAAGFYGHTSGGLWILKLNNDGTINWQKTYGITSDEIAGEEGISIQQTSDGGFIVAGTIDLTGSYDNEDFWILKLNNDGTIVWQKAYRFDNDVDIARSIQEVSGGGFIVAGRARSDANNINYVWILKLNNSGGIVWQKTYGENSEADSIQETSDGGFIVAGSYGSDFWVLKLNSEGICTPIDSDTSITPIDTSVTPSSTLTVTITDTTATVTPTSAMVIETNAIINQQAP